MNAKGLAISTRLSAMATRLSAMATRLFAMATRHCRERYRMSKAIMPMN